MVLSLLTTLWVRPILCFSIIHVMLTLCSHTICTGCCVVVVMLSTPLWINLIHLPPIFLRVTSLALHHYNHVIMTMMASQITSLTVVYSTVYSDADQRRHQSSASLAWCGEFTGTGEFPVQRASFAKNVSIWWGLHDDFPVPVKYLERYGCAFPGAPLLTWINFNPSKDK